VRWQTAATSPKHLSKEGRPASHSAVARESREGRVGRHRSASSAQLVDVLRVPLTDGPEDGEPAGLHVGHMVRLHRVVPAAHTVQLSSARRVHATQWECAGPPAQDPPPQDPCTV
jgi:hypothetical protein